MGEIVEVGSSVTKFKKGDRVVVPFTISCGQCHFCQLDQFSLCDDANPNADMAKLALGHNVAGIFGYSHMLGGFSGGQAEYVRVPFADVGPVKVPDSLSDDKAIMLADVFPTGYMAAENAQIKKGDTVAIWGCGPVGQFAIQCAWMLGAGRVIAIDSVAERIQMAQRYGKAETIATTERKEVYDTLMHLTKGRGPDCCIDAVGAEAHGGTLVEKAMDKAKELIHMELPRPYALQQIMYACKKGGNVSIPGVYVGIVNELPLGTAMNKGLNFKMGQTHVQHYLKPLMGMTEEGKIDPSFIITHRLKLDDAPAAYKTFKDKKDGCIKVVMTP